MVNRRLVNRDNLARNFRVLETILIEFTCPANIEPLMNIIRDEIPKTSLKSLIKIRDAAIEIMEIMKPLERQMFDLNTHVCCEYWTYSTAIAGEAREMAIDQEEMDAMATNG